MSRKIFRANRNVGRGSLFLLALGAGLLLLPISDSAAAQQGSGTRSDLQIESDVIHQIAASPELQQQPIVASTKDGDVTLKGTVASPAMKQEADTLVAQVSGVRSVNDEMALSSSEVGEGIGTPPPGAQPSAGASGNWGPAGPPPDARTPGAQMPDAQDGAAATRQAEAEADDSDLDPLSEPAAPTAPGRNTPAASSGNWGPAGPPPDVQDGRVPPPPPAAQSEAGVGYGPSGPAARPEYQPGTAEAGAGQRTAAPPPSARPRAVTLPAGTILRVRTTEPIEMRNIHQGDAFDVTAAQDVFEGDVLALPRGAELVGRVVEAKPAGALKGSPELRLQLTNLNLSGASYVLSTDTWTSTGPGKGGYTAGNAVGGAALGAVIGGIAGEGPGAAVGAVAGTGAGLGVSAATSGARGGIPPETMLTFHLTAPVTVRPVSYQEAQRLASASTPARAQYPPRVRRPYPYAYGPYPYGYGPPPPYYAPYPPYYYRYWR